jgi:dipeptidyl aminopeptidase/acylaminoacyl peptidase
MDRASSMCTLVPATGGVGQDLPIEDSYVARYFFPRLSADGRWLLYQNGNQIEVVVATGGKPTVLAEGGYPAWGPGPSVLFTNGAAGKGRTLWMAPFSAASGRLDGPARPLTFGRGADIQAAASADGTAIAFTAASETLNLEELTFDAETGRSLRAPRELTSGSSQIGFFDSSPDGKAFVFSADYGGGSHLWRVDPPAPPIELTRDSGQSESYPAWSPDGREIAFSRWTAGPAEASPTSLWIMNADGTTPRRVTETTGPAAWMPDGKAMLIPRGDQVLRVDLSSGATTPVPGANGRTAFMPDRSGRWLVFQAQTDPVVLEVVPAAGGTPRIVVDPATEAFHPFFSPSGRWFYIQRNHKNLFRIPGPAQDWKSAPPEKVTDFAGADLYIEEPQISKDGTKLFYTRGRTTGDIVVLHLGKRMARG